MASSVWVVTGGDLTVFAGQAFIIQHRADVDKSVAFTYHKFEKKPVKTSDEVSRMSWDCPEGGTLDAVLIPITIGTMHL